MIKSRQIFKYKKGQKLHLDQIYNISGVLETDWWEHIDEDGCGDEVLITKDVKITIIEE